MQSTGLSCEKEETWVDVSTCRTYPVQSHLPPKSNCQDLCREIPCDGGCSPQHTGIKTRRKLVRWFWVPRFNSQSRFWRRSVLEENWNRTGIVLLTSRLCLISLLSLPMQLQVFVCSATERSEVEAHEACSFLLISWFNEGWCLNPAK